MGCSFYLEADLVLQLVEAFNRNKQINNKANNQTTNQPSKQAKKQTSKQASKQTNKQTSKQANKQTRKQANKQTNTAPSHRIFPRSGTQDCSRRSREEPSRRAVVASLQEPPGFFGKTDPTRRARGFLRKNRAGWSGRKPLKHPGGVSSVGFRWCSWGILK